MVASLAAMGESIAGGIIFTLPALILWKFELSITTIIIVTIIGGLMGTFFITPLRRFLIVEEHGELVYPEVWQLLRFWLQGVKEEKDLKLLYQVLV